MKIENGWPPNIETLRLHFPITKQVIFCYGDTIFVPSGRHLVPSLVAHEEIHSAQQSAVGGPEPWWERYIADVKFRLEQELPAHIAEYNKLIKGKRGKHTLQQHLTEVAAKLSSPLYGNMISLVDAIKVIRGY